MTTNNHPANGPVSLDRLYQIREILSKAAAQSDGGNLGYAMADAVKVIDGAIASFGAEPVLYAAEETLAYAKMGELHLKCLSQPMGDAVIPLFRHSQTAPEVPDDLLSMAASAIEDLLEHTDPSTSYYSGVWADVSGKLRAAMLQGAEPVSNSDELPLDYLQGHKDGLEWAAQLAEANHPQTGDWLYDDPIELSRAIRKGPDMPELKSVPTDADDNFYSWFCREWEQNYQHNGYSLSAKKHLGAIAESAWFACRAAMLQAGNSPVIGIDLASEPDRSVEVRYLAPPGYVIVPIVPTEDMIINGFESVPDPHFSDEKEWEEYEALSGCRQAARRAELCWAAMIKAAPKQENI